MMTEAYGLRIIDMEHGSAYDRGAADAYYMRDPRPHVWPNGDHVREHSNLTDEQVKEYFKGYKVQYLSGVTKEWE